MARFYPPRLPRPPPSQALDEWRWRLHPPPPHHHHLSISSHIQINETAVLPIICRHVSEGRTNGIFFGENPLTYTFPFILFEFFVVVILTRLIRFLLKPLKQPKIISEIIAGILLGPSVLRHKTWFSKNIVPAGNAEFVVSNIGIMGFMFFLFVYGVKMDTTLIKKSGKKHISIALMSILIPSIAAFSVAMIMRKNMDTELAKITSLGGISMYMGLSSCPLLFIVLKENNLLSSEVGRTSISTGLIGDLVGIIIAVVFEAGKQGDTGAMHTLWYLISLVIYVVIFFVFIRRAMVWICDTTPEGEAVKSTYVTFILLGIFMASFMTDLVGLSIGAGALWLGLVIPANPPLGTTILEKTETLMTEFFMPFSFLLIGYNTDVYAMIAADWSYLHPLFCMALTAYLTKFFSTWFTTIYWRMPFRDGLPLSLLLSLRGQIELIMFMHWLDKKMIKPPGYTILVLMTIAVTAIFTPVIMILYDPSKPYMVNKRRTIQHTPPNTDLVIVLSILDRESIGGIINLLELSAPTSGNPTSILALHLIELLGRTNPIFFDHDRQQVPPKYKCIQTINALTHFQSVRGFDSVKLRFFTAITSKQTMYQDICEVALDNKATLIVLSLPRGAITHNLEGAIVSGDGLRAVISHVLTHAPCSVGILVDKSENLGSLIRGHNSVNGSFGRSGFKLAVLFLGGADCREALVYVDRMVAGNEDLRVTVVRFLAFNHEGETETEKKLDDGTMTWFWVKNERNENVEYREVVVEDGEQTVGAVQGMNDGSYDLWIVGRRHGMNPVIVSGLSNWSENEDLGVIGDYVASVDFSSSASVLVIQQQILRG
ncbi:cation/H(+) antiporter 24-like [Prosopis cineraria]|uniref:cation/H(+) antiporter 24-like n=1 Tax=Prosopis cineraria TaxID=364024 RepID=UPI0024104BE0|nr:cation/H(+) antiporter 24-like [Prosopis cineraria]